MNSPDLAALRVLSLAFRLVTSPVFEAALVLVTLAWWLGR